MEQQQVVESSEQETVEHSNPILEQLYNKDVLGPGICGHHCSLREVVEKSPNGVLLVDRQVCIHYANSTFRKMFRCGDKNVVGQPAAQILHSDYFKKAIARNRNFTVKDTISEYDLIYHARIFPVEGEHFYCGIFINISEGEEAKKHYYEIKAQTLKHAQEVISQQMKTAQEIARLLGETTAETKVLLVKLMSLFEEEQQ